MRTLSLRIRLLVIAAITIAATLAVAGASLVLVFERHLERRVDKELGVRLVEMLAAFSLDSDGRPTIRPLADPLYNRPLSGVYWQVVEDGEPVLRSRSLWDTALPTTTSGTLATEATERTGTNGETLYVLERNVTIVGGAKPRVFLLTVAVDHGELSVLRDEFSSDVGLVLGVIAIALMIGAWLQSGFGLRPLQTLSAGLERLRHGQAPRVEGRFPTEVAPLVADLNHLLAQQERAIMKARHRAGTLAHGLKTPLAILSGEANKLKRAGRLDEADVVRNQVETMEQHIERELARARTNPSSPAYGVRTDASLATNRLVDMMRRIPSEKPLTWRVEIAPGLMLHMDPHDFSEALGNLLDNSRKWAGSDVLVRGTIAGDRAFVCVEDDGPGVPEDQRGVVTERGWRGREDAKGSGLGLAIARDVLSEYGSGLEIGAREGGGSRFGFTLPAEIRAEASIAEPPRLRAAE